LYKNIGQKTRSPGKMSSLKPRLLPLAELSTFVNPFQRKMVEKRPPTMIYIKTIVKTKEISFSIITNCKLPGKNRELLEIETGIVVVDKHDKWLIGSIK
jgi:hypothetical protein